MAIEAADLNGKRIVVVEDDFLLANDMCRTLRDLGATVLGPAPTPFYAMHLIGRKKIDAAVLDIWLHGTTVFEVADMLQGQGVPILFTTASDRQAMPRRFQKASFLGKPFDQKKLVTEIQAMTRRPLARGANVIGPPPPPMVSLEVPAQLFARAIGKSMGAR